MRLLALVLIALLLPAFGQVRKTRRATGFHVIERQVHKRHRPAPMKRQMIRRLPRATYGTWV
ncbi:MAG: hypothetical protein FJW38_15485 [Acidobacteria bacterium]|nr:hypothetical protein [Acidobacteriota bacterium]